MCYYLTLTHKSSKTRIVWLDSTRLDKYSKYLSRILVFDWRLSRITRVLFIGSYTNNWRSGKFFSNSKARSSYSPNLEKQQQKNENTNLKEGGMRPCSPHPNVRPWLIYHVWWSLFIMMTLSFHTLCLSPNSFPFIETKMQKKEEKFGNSWGLSRGYCTGHGPT